jgi:hypothetical protein
MMRDPLFFTVPAGTRPSMCRSCYKRVFFITTTKNKRSMPVNCAVDGGSEPGTLSEGRGISHFADCPYAQKHRTTRAR